MTESGAQREMRLSEEIAQLEGLEKPSSGQRRRLRELLRTRTAVQKGLLVSMFGGGRSGERRYRKISRRQGHDKLWTAFTDATETLAGKRGSVWRLKAGLVALRWTRRWKKRLDRFEAVMRGSPVDGN